MPTPDEGLDLAARFERCFCELAAIGRDDSGGWTRLAWTEADRAAREWFEREATGRGLATTTDRNGNLWAWWHAPTADDAVVTGSHLDTVPNGGAYDGALGVVSGLLAVDVLQHRGVAPRRSIAVAAFADEEGGRFNTPTFGSRLLTGALEPASVLDRTDGDGVPLRDAMKDFGVAPADLGSDPALLERIGHVVELHVEQGRHMADLGASVGLCERILPHGRWRLTLSGEANHAGTTPLSQRSDPAVVLGHALLEARRVAAHHGTVATVGRLAVRPNSANSVPGQVVAWLDCRGDSPAALQHTVADWRGAVEEAAASHSCAVDLQAESFSQEVVFDADLRQRLTARLQRDGWAPAQLSTAAGHDAAVLAARVPSGMLFVRNPTGVSHSPREHATPQDCLQGVLALAAVLEELAS